MERSPSLIFPFLFSTTCRFFGDWQADKFPCKDQNHTLHISCWRHFGSRCRMWSDVPRVVGDVRITAVARRERRPPERRRVSVAHLGHPRREDHHQHHLHGRTGVDQLRHRLPRSQGRTLGEVSAVGSVYSVHLDIVYSWNSNTSYGLLTDWWTDERTNYRMDWRMDGRTNGRMDVWIDRWICRSLWPFRQRRQPLLSLVSAVCKVAGSTLAADRAVFWDLILRL